MSRVSRSKGLKGGKSSALGQTAGWSRTWADDFGSEQASTYQRIEDLRSASPWRTSESSWRAVSAPFLWAEQMAKDKAAAAAAAAAVAESNQEGADPFSHHQQVLGDAIRSSSNTNKFYIPISQLPPLRGPDPRLQVGRRPPSCCPQLSVSRASRIMMRWSSMPSLKSQLPPESLRLIQASSQQYADGRPTSRDQKRTERSSDVRRPSLTNSEAQMPLRREDTNHRLARAFVETEEGSARGRTEHPHIPCTCCDHEIHKPWMPGGGGSSARTLSAPNTGRASGRASSRASGRAVASTSETRASDRGHSRMPGGKPSISFAT